MSPELRGLLLSIQPSLKPDPDSLVFTTVIDSGNFRELWKEILSLGEIPYRKTHTTGYTMLSYAIEQGVPTGVAYLAGHANTW